MGSALEDELTGPSVFKDRSKLDYDWVPERLLHRDAEIGQLAQLFRGAIDGSMAQRALVTGRVGTGKTALAKWFARDLADKARAKGRILEHVTVNCRKNAAEGLVLLSILQHFDANYPARGFGVNEMLRDLRRHVDKRDTHLIVILDEADALIAKTQELIYALSRFDDERPVRKATLSVLLVSAREDLPDMLDASTRSTIKRSNVVALKPYNAQQLYAILSDRAKLAFHKGVVDDEVLQFIAEIAANEGDARYAIELLEGAGRGADEGREEHVLPEHVRAVKAHTKSVVSEAKLKLLAPHLRLVLLAACRKLSRSKRPYITTGELEKAYALVAEEYGETARGHTQFWKYLNELEVADWLHLTKKQTDAEGQTQHISLHDLPTKVLAAKIETLLKGEAPAKARKN